MTDYCFNEVIFYGNSDTVNGIIGFLGNDNGGFSFQTVCPEPDKRDDGWNGYEWRKENWSTKWECDNVQREHFTIDNWDYLYLKFDCPWNPPYKILDKILSMFPDVYVTFSFSLENDEYKTKVGVGHPGKGWNTLYNEDSHWTSIPQYSGNYSISGYFEYKGYVSKEIYETMNEIEGFQNSLKVLRFRDNWFEGVEFV